MTTIPFSLQEVEALRKGTKTFTLRIDEEHGTYLKGEAYDVTTYAGDPLGLTIRVLEVIDTTIPFLPGLGIPRKDIRQLEGEAGVTNHTRVDIIRFEVVSK